MHNNIDNLLKLLVKLEEKIQKDHGTIATLQKENDKLKKENQEWETLTKDVLENVNLSRLQVI
jgi:FtsZ-binding cell division protein ZapB